MLEPPAIPGRLIRDALESAYGLRAGALEFLPIGYDVNTAVFRVTAGDQPYFLKLRRVRAEPHQAPSERWGGNFSPAPAQAGALPFAGDSAIGAILPRALADLGIPALRRAVIPPLLAQNGRPWAELADPDGAAAWLNPAGGPDRRLRMQDLRRQRRLRTQAPRRQRRLRMQDLRRQRRLRTQDLRRLPCMMILSPFIAGEDGYTKAPTPAQWRDFGAALGALHAAGIQQRVALASTKNPGLAFPQENFSPYYRELVSALLAQAEAAPYAQSGGFADPVAEKTAAFMRSQRERIRRLVGRAEMLAQVMWARYVTTRVASFVLCHNDIHPGNLLLASHPQPGHSGLYLVDWDAPLLAPRERDLALIGGSAHWSDPRDVAAFYEGYESAPETLHPQPAAPDDLAAAPESLHPQPAAPEEQAAPESLHPQPAAPDDLAAAPESLHPQPAAPESLHPQPAATVDRAALSYYRYERILSDIGEFGKQLLLTSEGGADREQSYQFLAGAFLPGRDVEIAEREDR